jgi:hypothetical protein
MLKFSKSSLAVFLLIEYLAGVPNILQTACKVKTVADKLSCNEDVLLLLPIIEFPFWAKTSVKGGWGHQGLRYGSQC